MTRIDPLRRAALAAAALHLLGAAPGCAPAGADDPGAVVLPVEVVTARRESGYAERRSYAGRVVARRASDLGFERAGRLDEVLADQGDRVEAGQVLARLDTRELRAERRRLLARRGEIEARLELARLTTQRRRKLHEAGHLASQALDETVFAERALEAERAAAVAAIENVEVRLDLSELRAPYAGSITGRQRDEGSVVSPGEPILSLIEDGVLEVHVGVPAGAAAELRAGSSHEIQVGDMRLQGELRATLAQVEVDTRTVRLVFRLAAPPARIRSGALARVTLEARVVGDGYWVPITALSESRRGLWTAYAVVEDGAGGWQVDRCQLDLIHADAERAFVRGTLRDGDRVVATGVHRLVPGQAVRPSSLAAER